MIKVRGEAPAKPIAHRFDLTIGGQTVNVETYTPDVFADTLWVLGPEPKLPSDATHQQKISYDASVHNWLVSVGVYLFAYMLSTSPDVELDPPFPGRPKRSSLPTVESAREWKQRIDQWRESLVPLLTEGGLISVARSAQEVSESVFTPARTAPGDTGH